MQKTLVSFGVVLLPSISVGLTVGDGAIQGDKLAPYQYTWKQCAKQDGAWTPLSDLTEELVTIGDSIFRHRQTRLGPNDVSVVSTTYFSRASLAPLRMETKAVATDGQTLMASFRDLDESGYQGVARGKKGEEVLAGKITSNMLHGGALGLPLTTLAKDKGSEAFKASMMQFDATYDVVVTWRGQEPLEFEGHTIDAFVADVRWHHHETGDVYEPGPEGSGGRFWLVPNPPSGFPYVPRYKTDSYAVEFVPDTCRH